MGVGLPKSKFVWSCPCTKGPCILQKSRRPNVLHISLSTLRRWRKKGTGPEHFHFGDIIRYSDAALEAFVTKYSTNAA
jgi:hypothetical protein